MKRVFAFLIAAFWASPALADYDAAAEYSASLRGVSFLVIQDGEVVFEDYPNDGAADNAHPLASGTKSFAGILAAAAVQDGLLSLDENVSDTITEWQGSRREEVTIRQLLTLRSGLRSPSRSRRLITYDVAIRARLQFEPGTVFQYGPLPFQIFGELMRRKLEGDPLEYLTRRVLDPIGLDVTEWRRDRQGNPSWPTGAQLTARNWARLGEFVLARGEWNGEPLVSRAAFDELFVGSQANPVYGLTWWLNEPVNPLFASETSPLNNSTDFWHHQEVFPLDMVFAAGAGNQRLFVSWDRNIVVVRQAEGILGDLMGQRLSWSDVRFFQLLDAAPGELPEVLPPIDIDALLPQSQGAAVELPSGAILQLPPVADETAELEEAEAIEPEPEEEASDGEEFVGPSY